MQSVGDLWYILLLASLENITPFPLQSFIRAIAFYRNNFLLDYVPSKLPMP